MSGITREWESPYQDPPYNKSLSESGIEVESVPTEKGLIFFNKLTTDHPTAWEVNLPVRRSLFPNTYEVWRYAGADHTDNVAWNQSDYFTPFIDDPKNYSSFYRDSNTRNIKKATKLGMTYKVVSCGSDLKPSLELLNQNDDYRGRIDKDLFFELVTRLITNGSAECHIACLNKQVASVAVVIKSASIANLRFVASNPSLLYCRPVNFLYDKVISYYFSKGFGRVDLSGTVSPDSDDPKLLNIAQFKYGFTRQITIFNHL